MDETDRCPATNREGEQCGHPEGWGTENDSGPCKYHGGASSGGVREGAGAPEDNANALTHGAQADPHGLYDHLGEEDQKWVDALTAAYVEESVYSEDSPQAERIEVTVVMAWQERSGRARLIKEGLERETVVGVAEHGPVSDLTDHHLNTVVSSLNTDIRMNLKDLGLLDDPESQKADAIGELKDLWKASAQGGGS